MGAVVARPRAAAPRKVIRFAVRQVRRTRTRPDHCVMTEGRGAKTSRPTTDTSNKEIQLMLKLLAPALIALALSTGALASPGRTTTGVNLRAGPGTNFSTLQVLPAGAAVDVTTCDDAGAWCAVTYKGGKGFVSGRYLQASNDKERWPRAFDIGQGRLVLHQPQFNAWTDFKLIEALVAAEYSKGPSSKPVFGVIGLRGKTAYNDEDDKVVISDIVVTELNFSSLGREELDALAIGVGKLLPTGPLTIPEARIAASLANQKRMVEAKGLKAEPPPILVSKAPAILLQTNGAPVFAPVKGKDGVSFLVNTNWDLLRIDAGGVLYLRDDTHWLTAPAMEGPWTAVAALPAALASLPDDGNWTDARAASRPEPYPGSKPPRVIVSPSPLSSSCSRVSRPSRTSPAPRSSGPRTPRRTSSSIGTGSNGMSSCPGAGSARRASRGPGRSQRPIFPPVSGPFLKALRITPFAPRCRARRRAPKRG